MTPTDPPVRPHLYGSKRTRTFSSSDIPDYLKPPGPKSRPPPAPTSSGLFRRAKRPKIGRAHKIDPLSRLSARLALSILPLLLRNHQTWTNPRSAVRISRLLLFWARSKHVGCPLFQWAKF